MTRCSRPLAWDSSSVVGSNRIRSSPPPPGVCTAPGGARLCAQVSRRPPPSPARRAATARADALGAAPSPCAPRAGAPALARACHAPRTEPAVPAHVERRGGQAPPPHLAHRFSLRSPTRCPGARRDAERRARAPPRDRRAAPADDRPAIPPLSPTPPDRAVRGAGPRAGPRAGGRRGPVLRPSRTAAPDSPP